MADVNCVWTRAESGRLCRNESSQPNLVECIVCNEHVQVYYYCLNDHKTCINCMERHFINECGKMNSQFTEYITGQIDHINKFKLVCCPLLRACDYNIDNMFDVLSLLREKSISTRTASIIFKTKQHVDRAIGHAIARRIR